MFLTSINYWIQTRPKCSFDFISTHYAYYAFASRTFNHLSAYYQPVSRESTFSYITISACTVIIKKNLYLWMITELIALQWLDVHCVRTIRYSRAKIYWVVHKVLACITSESKSFNYFHKLENITETRDTIYLDSVISKGSTTSNPEPALGKVVCCLLELNAITIDASVSSQAALDRTVSL